MHLSSSSLLLWRLTKTCLVKSSPGKVKKRGEKRWNTFIKDRERVGGKKSMPISSAPMNFIEAGPDVIRSQILPVLD